MIKNLEHQSDIEGWDKNDFISMIANLQSQLKNCKNSVEQWQREVNVLNSQLKERDKDITKVIKQWNKDHDRLQNINKELYDLISGLIRDFDEVISDYDIEPNRAGYLVEAKELLKLRL